MFKARYYKVDGTKGRARALPDSLFDGVVNDAVLHQVVKAYLNNQRQGTGSAKNRSAARGGSRKPWRQKGTGRARQGTIRAPQWAGGGRAFPPIPHSWRQQVPRKMKALARRSAFNARAGEDRVVLVDAPTFEAPKTRELRAFLKGIEVDGRKVLILTHGLKPTFHLSARNLPRVEVRPFGEEAAYDILWADVVIIEREAIDAYAKGTATDDETAVTGGKTGAAASVEETAAEEAEVEAAEVEGAVEEAAAEEAEVEEATAEEASEAAAEDAEVVAAEVKEAEAEVEEAEAVAAGEGADEGDEPVAEMDEDEEKTDA